MNDSNYGNWYNRMVRKLQINGKSERTQQAYTRAIRQLTIHLEKNPEAITENELEDYFLYRRNESEWATATLRICYIGVKFYFLYVLEKEWKIFSILKSQKEQRLPAVLPGETVHLILSNVKTLHNFVFFSTVYACGLRLQEALYLQVSDIDSKRMMLHVHRGKGAKDRYVPIPQETLQLLRKYWKTHRNPNLIFPALGRGHTRGPISTVPMNRSSVQGAFIRAKKKANVNKRGVSIHTLRHYLEFKIMSNSIFNSLHCNKLILSYST